MENGTLVIYIYLLVLPPLWATGGLRVAALATLLVFLPPFSRKEERKTSKVARAATLRPPVALRGVKPERYYKT
jgi:hypothetical protein